MIGEVQADADELARTGNASAKAAFRQFRQALRIESRNLCQARGRNGLAADIGDMGGEIADLAIAIQKRRLFLADFANAQKFHGFSFPAFSKTKLMAPYMNELFTSVTNRFRRA